MVLFVNEIFLLHIEGWEEETHLITVYRYFPRCIPECSSFILIENSNIHDYLNKPDRVSESHRLCAADPRCVSASKLRNLVLPRTGKSRQAGSQAGSKLSCLSPARRIYVGELLSRGIAPHHWYTYTCIYIVQTGIPYIYVYRISKRDRIRPQ